MERLEIEISGRVQGVHYRSTIASIAKSLKLKGFVESPEENMVRVIAEGDYDNLDELLRWCQKGTFLTKIEGMSFKFTKPKNKFKGFDIKSKDGFLKDKIKGITTLGKRVGKRVTGAVDTTKSPKHIVIIPDGNRRWAREKNWHPWVGHLQVTKNKGNLMELFAEATKLGVEYVTFWAFSTENWKRDQKEIDVLLGMMRNFSGQLLAEAQKRGIRFRHLGRKDRLPADIVKKIDELESKTVNNQGLNIQFAIDYGGRDELIRAFQKMKDDEIVNIDESVVNEYLDTANEIPDADLIIRTGGEQRTSGIMMWQAHYAELYFTNVLFPDFSAEHLKNAVLDFMHRVRRFGGDNKKDIKNINVDKLHAPEEKEIASLAMA